MANLIVRKGPLAGHQIVVDRDMVIGRHDTDVVINDPELSRRHLLIRPVPGGLELEDLGSTNGTRVNGRAIATLTHVAEGALVEVGQTVFEVRGVTPGESIHVHSHDGEALPGPDARGLAAEPHTQGAASEASAATAPMTPAARPSPPGRTDPLLVPPSAPEPLRRRLAAMAVAIPTGRYTRFLVIIAAFIVLVTIGKNAVNLTNVQKSASVDVLPSNAQSTKEDRQAREFPSGSLSPADVIYRRDSGLTAADKTLVNAQRAQLKSVKGVGEVGSTQYSKDGTSALVIARISPRAPGVLNAVKAIRKLVGHGGGGLQADVSGPAGFTTDSADVFGSIDATLFLVTLGLVLVLLIAIYRSPIFWIVPIIAIVFAVATSRGFAYLLGKNTVTITGQAGGVMTVLIFGVGTDYTLLLVARYREELLRHESVAKAVAEATREAASAIIPSALTVTAGLLCLLLADVKSTSGLGAIGAVGVVAAMIAMLMLLPALLCLAGRRIFWPFVPHAGEVRRTDTAWTRVAQLVARMPGRIGVASLLVLAAMAVGLVDLNTSLTSETSFRNTVDSVTGQKLIAKAYPAGTGAPAAAIVTESGDVTAAQSAIRGTRRVASVGSAVTSHGEARFEFIIAHDPYAHSGFDDIKAVRSALAHAGFGSALVGGSTAEDLDLRTAQTRDNELIIPIVLVLVVIILCLVLRAIVAPLLLISTVVASYGATLGIISFLATNLFGYAGLDPSLPLLGFILLVALGVDYNIFLMTRVRSETAVFGTRDGMTRGLAATGGVITSAGVVLAGTFAMLAVLPLIVLTEIGMTIAIGALLDTFLVRSLLVPALVHKIGPPTWWPSRLTREDRLARPERVAA